VNHHAGLESIENGFIPALHDYHRPGYASAGPDASP